MSKIDTIKANAKEAALATYSSERTASLIKNEIPFILDRLESLEKIAGELEETSRCPIGCSSHRGTLDLCNCDRGIARAALAAWIKDGESCPA